MRLFAFFLGLVVGFVLDQIGSVPICNALAAGLVGLVFGLVFRADKKDAAWFMVAGISLGTFIVLLAFAAFDMNPTLLLLAACYGLIIASLNGLGASAGVWLSSLVLRLAGMIGRK
jgi:hypothetical protein